MKIRTAEQPIAAPAKNPASIKGLLDSASVKKRFEEMLGRRAPQFISSVLQVINANKRLQTAEPMTVLNAAATAATLDLPINRNLGFAWIVPYTENRKNPQTGRYDKVAVAQFQMGWKGYVQLALRTRQYKTINVVTVYANQFKGWNRLTEDLEADFGIVGEGEVVGYAAYFKTVDGFEKLDYWTKEEVVAHAKKYSQSYSHKSSPWQDADQFDAMAKKTVLKNTLSKWGIMSVEYLAIAIEADQSVQRNPGEYDYADNPKSASISEVDYQKERERLLDHIALAPSIVILEQVKNDVNEFDAREEYEDRYRKLVELETEEAQIVEEEAVEPHKNRHNE